MRAPVGLTEHSTTQRGQTSAVNRLFVPKMREQNHIPNRRRVGQQHDEPIDTNPLPRRRRQAIFQRANIIVIKMHRLVVTGLFGRDLRFKAIRLILRVVELAETIGQLASADKKLEAIGHKGVVVVAPRQWRHFGGVRSDKGWLLKLRLCRLLKNLDLNLAEAPAFLDLCLLYTSPSPRDS